MDGRVRFGGRWANLRSGTFVVSTSVKTPDIYILSRAIGRQHRVSLHQSGSWRLSVEPIDIETGRPGSPIHGETFSRPAEYAPGLTKIFAVVLPRAGMTLPIADSDRDVLFVPVRGDAWGLQFSLILSAAGTYASSWPGARGMHTTLVGRSALVSNETLWVVAHELTEGPGSDGEPRTGSLLPGHDMSELKEALDEGTLRTMAWGRDSDGMRWMMETAIVRKEDVS
jgi:hypothetical protein